VELSLENISVNLAGKEILRSINLTIPDGALVALLGPSGCGKSTLLKTIAGIISQSRGSIKLGGESADNLPPYKRGTVIVFQDLRLFPHLTALENIAFPLKMQGVKRSIYEQKALELLEKVQLLGLEKRKPHEMSGGQIQRIALARALAAEPKVLLLDEPFSSLDENLRQDMRNLVLKLQREYKITTILVTHDRQEALSMSDKIALMMEGSILQYDTPERVFEYPVSREVADFFGEAIYVDGVVKENTFYSDLASFTVTSPNGSYHAMFRPSAVQLGKGSAKNFEICALSYQGEYYNAVLKHIETGISMTTKIPVPCNFSVGDLIAVTLDESKTVLFPKVS
jgi:putative spermidine/putrescine transport system ATP-binding protein